ncbi:MAG: hypothetical protein IAE78_20535 [Myxococcus sp.]|nr:hypothetical protein [Myxococcus sp.]
MSAADTEAEGMKALMEGRAGDAVALLNRAADEFIAEQDDPGAVAVLANLAFLHRQQHELSRALELANQALAFGVAPADSAMALVNCAGVLDRALDRRARGVWMLAAQGFTGKQPLMQVVCLAHAIGAELAHQGPAAVSAARALLAQVNAGAPTPMLAGFVGAIGDSAGPAGLPFLAQAVGLMVSDPTAFTASTQPHWALLVERLGADHALAVPLCAFGLGAALARRGAPDFQAVSSGVRAVFEACARARGLDDAAFAALTQQHAASLEALPDALLALVTEGSWVLPRRA